MENLSIVEQHLLWVAYILLTMVIVVMFIQGVSIIKLWIDEFKEGK